MKKKKQWKKMFLNGKPTNYIISNYGDVKSMNYKGSGKAKNMKQFNHKGYRAVNLTIDGKLRRTLVHRLVAENFIVDLKCRDIVNHKNGKKHCNYYENLEWCTHSENIQHAVDHNLIHYHYGEDNWNSKITKKQAKQICKLLEQNKLSLDEIAFKVNAPRGVVYSIKYGATWKDVSKHYNVSKHNVQPKRNNSKKKRSSKKIDPETVIKICEDLAYTDLSILDISKKYDVPKGKVEQIRYKNAWDEYTKNYDFSNRNQYKKHKK